MQSVRSVLRMQRQFIHQHVRKLSQQQRSRNNDHHQHHRSSGRRWFQWRHSRVFGGMGGAVGVVYGASMMLRSPEEQERLAGLSPALRKLAEPPKSPICFNYDEVKVTRKIVSPVDNSGLNLRLYQFETCPFCSKVRAFLDYYGFSYEVVEVNPVTRKELKSANSKKVPLLVIRGEGNQMLSDSSFLISVLRSWMLDPSVGFRNVLDWYPILELKDDKDKSDFICENKYFIMFNEKITSNEGMANTREEREWREWVDSHFVHMISPNVYRTLGEALDTFRWFSVRAQYKDNFSAWEELLIVYVGAVAMYWIGKRLKKRYNLKEDVRESLYDACETWTRGLGKHRPFMGGQEPNVADLTLYGAMTSFEGSRAFADMTANTDIAGWFHGVQTAVQNRYGSAELEQSVRKIPADPT